MLEIRSLSKNYGKFKALDNTSWSLGKNRTLGLLGPNGAGKSTTLNVIAGLLRPSSGEVLIESLSTLQWGARQRAHIGFLPETAPLYNHMSVKNYLFFAAGLRGVLKKDQTSAVLGVVDELQLGSVYLKSIGKLSKGFRQRVGIAQALVHRPSILILDEPTLGLDPKQVIEFRQLIHSLKKEHTIILSTHILQEVEQICDDVVVLKKGQVAYSGPLISPADGKDKPQKPIDLESFFTEMEPSVVSGDTGVML